MKTSQNFTGKIKIVSTSPHGDVEGLVLEDGTFIKTPPHSLIKQDLLKPGMDVSGKGELLCETPNMVFHHARVSVADVTASDDSLDKDAKEKMKDKHKRDVESRAKAPSQEIKLKGKVVAIGMKPKGEVDRLIFDDGTSVHLGKDVELFAAYIAIGDIFEVFGEARTFGANRFVKAEKVKAL